MKENRNQVLLGEARRWNSFINSNFASEDNDDARQRQASNESETHNTLWMPRECDNDTMRATAFLRNNNFVFFYYVNRSQYVELIFFCLGKHIHSINVHFGCVYPFTDV